MLEVNAYGGADSGTIPPTEKEGSNDGIAENHNMTSNDVVRDAGDTSKVSESTSSKIKERGGGAEETSSQIEPRKSMAMKHMINLAKDAVPTDCVADTDGKATPSKSAMMKQQKTPAKKAIVVTAPLPTSTAANQKKAMKDAVTVISKDKKSYR